MNYSKNIFIKTLSYFAYKNKRTKEITIAYKKILSTNYSRDITNYF